MDFDGSDIELTCPGCGGKFKEKLGRLKKDPTVDCPHCHKSIKIEARGLRDGLKSVEKSIADFKRAMERLNKR